LLYDNPRQLVLMRIADHPAHARQCRDFFRSALRIASGYYDLSVWVGSMGAPDGSARILIGGGCDRACIQYDYFSRVRILRAFETLLEKLAFDRGPVRLGGAAPKIFYVERTHTPILAELGGVMAPPLMQHC